MRKNSIFGGRRRGRHSDLNVIDPGLRRSVRRRAGIAFFVVGAPVALLVAMIAASYMHVILALLLGVVVGAVLGLVIAAAVLVWPVARVIWHWAPEIAVTGGLLVGLNELATIVWPPLAIAALAVLVGGVLAVPVSRKHVTAWSWCVISRHRLRVCFSAFLAGNRDGSLPLILIARPTPVGERVWIWLRPGLSLSMLQDRVEQIAVTCWANDVTVQRASDKYAGFLRFDIKRRNTLAGDISSPLAVNVPDNTEDEATEGDTTRQVSPVQVAADVAALDLPDVPEKAVTEPAGSRPVRKPATKPEPAKREPVVVGADGEDVSDWI